MQINICIQNLIPYYLITESNLQLKYAYRFYLNPKSEVRINKNAVEVVQNIDL